MIRKFLESRVPSKFRPLTIALAVAVLLFAFDRVSKYYVLSILDLPAHGRIEVLPVFDLAMAWNYGVNFGLMASDSPYIRYGLAIFSLLVSFALIFWVIRKNSMRLALGVGPVVGGALGNAFDRVNYGAVADFLNFHCCGLENPWSFNIADLSIFLGLVWLVICGSEAKEKE